MTARVLYGELKQESNSFSPLHIDETDFAKYHLHRGRDIETHLAGTSTEIGGFIQVAQCEGLELVPTLAAMAMSGGPMTLETYHSLGDELLERFQRALPADGILLALHGAMLVSGIDDPEAMLLGRLRNVAGDIPIVITLDLHANLSPGLIRYVDAIEGFNTCPHTDLHETGVRAARLLLSMLPPGGDNRPCMAWTRIPMIMPPDVMDTDTWPLSEIMAAARAECQGNGILSTSIFMVQPWLDVPNLGCSVLTVASEPSQQVEEVTAGLARALWERRRDLRVDMYPVDEAIDLALACTGGPIVFSDSADSIGSGATGDATGILRGLLGAMDRLPGDALTTIVDPEAAREAYNHCPGARISLDVGGKLDRAFNSPVHLDGVLRSLFHGDFVLSGPSYTNLAMRMGPTAVIEVGRVKVIITSNRTWTHSPDIYRSVGLEPCCAKIVTTKSNIQFRASYAPIAQRILWIDSPGTSSPNLTRLPYQRITRPLYPFEDFDWCPTIRFAKPSRC